ncbi:MAG: D-alanyl-D-alanine carboxypeptidase/D-alanyl-D-alanine-endopeptidase [Actinomycetota bacterium]|nr:D-alanyl-D-alanine carboxypeptidase/D-alanyl-D-alanine-endopeptidase [Actinomycetota bacterium]MDH4352666.1 D-alanyl-D-alanine carboxypeptidase/D-alanyl-D-alanine-endopeptidase [Actinomycetota bacterium]MDH5277703.1 D-alanyl-D-alanine carboxypeptidase/D-alanyl-D-alanine-endopeptidase [Actinomycetota bacterium]
MSRTRWYLVAALAVVTVAVVTLDATGVIFQPGVDAPQTTVVTMATPGPPEAALQPSVDEPLPAEEVARLQRTVERALGADELGRRVSAYVATSGGQSVLDERSTRAGVPASTVKLFTALAALDVLDPEFRIVTRVVAGPDARSVVLVGGGDATLATSRPARRDVQVASLEQLAGATGRSLQARGITRVRLLYDDSLFTGPAVAPTWGDTYVSSGVVAPVTALMVDQGLVDPSSGSLARESDPARAAAGRFAALLADRGIAVRGEVTRAAAPGTAEVLAEVASPVLSALVERMLTDSDNQLAEALGRLAALASGRPASFTGAGATLLAQAQLRDVETSGSRLFDASGLSRPNRLAPVGTAGVLTVAAADPTLRPLTVGLPVAGLTGTLADRYLTGRSARGAGLVRAKTGTLTGVAAEAGLVVACEGRLVVFSFVADRVPFDIEAARAALDRAATALASCPAA